jgi:integrase
VLGRQHISDGVIVMRTEKTGAPLTIPILPELARVIEATKTGDLTFIATATGAPMRKESFGNWCHEACVAAGVPGPAHGLRKAGAARAANNGATVAQLNAIFGWSDSQMASLEIGRPSPARERSNREAGSERILNIYSQPFSRYGSE